MMRGLCRWRAETVDLHVTELDGPVTRVALAGRLDAAGADQIGIRFTAATASAARPAIVDLSQVGFVASMGIRLLISSARALDTKGFKLVLFGAQPHVEEVLLDAAVDQIVPLVADEAAALALAAG